MKAKFFALLAVVLAVVSCQKDVDNLDVNVGGDVATISVALPADAITRAAADETDSAWSGLANTTGEIVRVILQVYDAEGRASDERLVNYLENGATTTNFDLRLVPERNYTFVAWADQVNSKDDVDNHYITKDANGKSDLNNITLNSEWNAMDETRDAFTGKISVENFNSGKSIPTLELKRPFAKLRVVTTDLKNITNLGITPAYVKVEYQTPYRASFNAYTSEAYAAVESNKKSHTFEIAEYGDNDENNMVLFTDYFFAENDVVKFNMSVYEDELMTKRIGEEISFNTDIYAKRNYLTTIKGTILTKLNDIEITIDDKFAGENGVVNGASFTTVSTADELADAISKKYSNIIIAEDINLNEATTRAATDPSFTIDYTVTIDLNGKTVSATSAASNKNYDMFYVTNNGDLTVKNGIITCKHEGNNMGWNNCTDIFRVSFTGKLNLDGVTAKNLGGSDMAYVVDMSNATNLFVNIKYSTLESPYIPVRVFNNNGKHNVSINNSTLTGKYCFWVQYWLGDGRDQATLDETLNISIYNQENTFNYTGNSAVIYGFNTPINANENGITKEVSEDGTVVTLDSMVENGVVDRGVAGTEENNTIKKVIVGEGITTLYDRTFRRFYALETVELPSTLTTIGVEGTGVFQSCTVLNNIVIPESVTVLGKGSFQECSSLTSINIPAGVTRIEENCLRATGLVSVEFHAGVTYFGAQAFRDCKQLKEVYINAPEFTIEPNAFGVMSGTLPGTTIYVANAKMKEYLENTLSYKNQFTIVAPKEASNADLLADALANGENVVLTQDVTSEAATTAPYGNKYAFKQDGGVIDGNGHELHMECYGDDYGIMTSGGTIKNITIKEGCRAVMIMYPQQDVVLDNVKIGGDGVLYPINTGEAGAEGVNLIVTNSVLAGWTSYGLIESASFTNVEFKQGTYYNNIYGRVLKPYVNTTLTNCSFVEHMNLDLSALKAGHKIVMKNCTVNGQAVTVTTFTIPANDAQYDTELFTIDLPSWATSINDCVVFE